MTVRKAGVALLLLLMTVLLGIVLAVGDYTEGRSGGVENLAAQIHFAFGGSGPLAALVAGISEALAFYRYILNRNLLFFGGIAVFGLLMVALSIRRAVAISREKERLSSPSRPSRSRYDVRSAVRGLARLPVSITWNPSLRWTVARKLTGVVCLVGLFVIATAYHFMDYAVRRQLDQRALGVATNLSDGVAAHMAQKNNLGLHALVAKYGLLDGVAYAVVQDAEGKLLAQSWGDFPPELAESLSADNLREIRRQTIRVRGQQVYETRVPILGGQLGAVHIGIWGAAVEEEIQPAIRTLLLCIVGILVFGFMISVVLAGKVTYPLVRLSRLAEQMSKGDLDTPINVETSGEVSDLALSLERMRASLKAAILRLDRQNVSRHIPEMTSVASSREGVSKRDIPGITSRSRGAANP